MGPKNKGTQMSANFNICSPWSTTPPRVVFFSKEKMSQFFYILFPLEHHPPGVVFFSKEKMSQILHILLPLEHHPPGVVSSLKKKCLQFWNLLPLKHHSPGEVSFSKEKMGPNGKNIMKNIWEYLKYSFLLKSKIERKFTIFTNVPKNDHYRDSKEHL